MPSMLPCSRVRSIRHQRPGSPGQRWREATEYHALHVAKHGNNGGDRHLGGRWAVRRQGPLRSLEKQRERSSWPTPMPSPCRRRWRSVGRTSWPVSPLQDRGVSTGSRSLPTVARIVGHFSDTKRIRIARRNHQRRAFAVAKYPSNRRYPRATTTMVRESLVLGRRFLVYQHVRRGLRQRGATDHQDSDPGAPRKRDHGTLDRQPPSRTSRPHTHPQRPTSTPRPRRVRTPLQYPPTTHSPSTKPPHYEHSPSPKQPTPRSFVVTDSAEPSTNTSRSRKVAEFRAPTDIVIQSWSRKVIRHPVRETNQLGSKRAEKSPLTCITEPLAILLRTITLR